MSVLEIDRLSKSYGSLRALQDMTFSVRGGEIFGFVGSNGAGKTTTMRIALGVLAADSGQVRWNGRPLDLEARRRVGYMPEERGLYPKMKVGEQLVYLARLHGMSTTEATASMERWTERLGVALRRRDEVQKLSLGNQQRVQLAAALIHDPEVLVLDEPFSGLDPVAVDVMSSVLREQADTGVPVIFSSHQLDLVERLCDRVGIVRSGRMEAQGTIDELRSTDRPRWAVTVTPAAGGGSTDWARDLPGVHPVEWHDDTLVLDLDPGGGPGTEQQVLQAAMAAGQVREFRQVRPSLTDLFRDVVSQTDEPDGDDGAGGGHHTVSNDEGAA